jgi:hypothetical protein
MGSYVVEESAIHMRALLLHFVANRLGRNMRIYQGLEFRGGRRVQYDALRM